MVFRIVCSECDTPLYSGYDLKSARDVLRSAGGRCEKCGVRLAPYEFAVKVESKFS